MIGEMGFFINDIDGATFLHISPQVLIVAFLLGNKLWKHLCGNILSLWVLCHIGIISYCLLAVLLLCMHDITMECRYDAVQYNKILHTSLQDLRQNINQRLNPQNTPHSSPVGASYGVSLVNIYGKIDCIIMALHCICCDSHSQLSFHEGINTLSLRENGHYFTDDTLKNAFSWMKILEFWTTFHWSLFLRV